jgi:glycosyltransferase involved in cell wall biosynthesis
VTKPLVSIIIPTHNEQEHILECLKSLKRQDYHPVEIIVVDDGSTDKTVEIIKSIDTAIFQQQHLGAGAARNLGARKAKGEILVFVDADMTFDPDFVSKLIAPIIEGKTIGTFTKEERVSNQDNPWAFSWSVLRGFPPGKMHPQNYPNTQPVFRAILKPEFDRVKGFDSNRGYDDDWSLSEKMGKMATAVPGAIVYHANPGSPEEIYTQAQWMAKRKYKWGILGKIITLLRHNLLFSLIKGVKLASQYKKSELMLAALIFDCGISIGIVKSLINTNYGR